MEWSFLNNIINNDYQIDNRRKLAVMPIADGQDENLTASLQVNDLFQKKSNLGDRNDFLQFFRNRGYVLESINQKQFFKH